MPELELMPHHDGSALYISNQNPKLSERVKIRIRIHSSLGKISLVSIRQSDSGEAFLTDPAKKLMTRHGWIWYETSITMFNPTVGYRFLIELTNGDSFWYNTMGLHQLDQPDALDFQINIFSAAPRWAASSVLYQIFPDTFASSGLRVTAPEWAVEKQWHEKVAAKGATTAQQLFGGDLIGAMEKLEHLKTIGATVLYLTPFFPAQSNHRYDATSFDVVDPLLGGNKALTALVGRAHQMGLRVMGDLTSNHSGAGHEWFVAAYKNPKAVESDFYYFNEDNSEYESWWGVKSLPKFNWNSAELRKRFIAGKTSVVAKWLKAPYKLDGWRIDVANMTGRVRDQDLFSDVGKTIRSTMDSVNPDSFLIGEYTADAGPNISGEHYQGAMTYNNFTRPIWRWLHSPRQTRAESMLGPGRRGIDASQFASLYNRFIGAFPWHVRMHNLNALDTHDSGRFKTFAIEGSQRVAAGLQFTIPGIPMIFAGDEFGLDGLTGEGSRTPIPWNDERPNDQTMISTYSVLSSIRKKHKALVTGSMRWLYLSKEAVVFIRETKTESILVLAARGRDRKISFASDAVGSSKQIENLYGGGEMRVVGSQLRYDAVALDFQIWKLPSAVR